MGTDVTAQSLLDVLSWHLAVSDTADGTPEQEGRAEETL